MGNLPTLMTIATSADESVFYAEAAGILDYNHISLHDEWNNGNYIAKGFIGPLSLEFVKELIKDNPKKYDGIVVDENCDDLIEPLKQSGYKGPIIGITTSVENIAGANASVSTYTVKTFSNRLKSTLTDLIKRE